MTRNETLIAKAGPAPEGATHLDPGYPEFMKLGDSGQWYYWRGVGSHIEGFRYFWEPEAEANTRAFFTKDYINLENPNMAIKSIIDKPNDATHHNPNGQWVTWYKQVGDVWYCWTCTTDDIGGWHKSINKSFHMLVQLNG